MRSLERPLISQKKIVMLESPKSFPFDKKRRGIFHSDRKTSNGRWLTVWRNSRSFFSNFESQVHLELSDWAERMVYHRFISKGEKIGGSMMNGIFLLEMRTALVVVCCCTCVHFFRRFNHSPGFIIATTTFSIELISVCVRIPYGKSSAILLDFANQSHTRNCTSSSTLKIYAVQHSLCSLPSLRLLRPLHLCLTGCL